MINYHRTAAVSRPQPNLQVYHNANVPFEDIFQVFFELFGKIYPTRDLRSMIASVHHVFSVYDDQRRCVASALVNQVNNKGLYLMLFGVRQSDQGRGTGTFFLKRIVQWARRTRHTFIYLHVHADNEKAIGLYRKVGFQIHEYLPNFYEATPKRPAHGYRMVFTLK